MHLGQQGVNLFSVEREREREGEREREREREREIDLASNSVHVTRC